MPKGGVGKEKNTKEKLSKKQYGEKQNRSDTCETFSSKFLMNLSHCRSKTKERFHSYEESNRFEES